MTFSAALEPFLTGVLISYFSHSASSLGALPVAMHASNRKTSQLRWFLATHLIRLCRRKALLGLKIMIVPVHQPATSPSSLPPQ